MARKRRPEGRARPTRPKRSVLRRLRAITGGKEHATDTLGRLGIYTDGKPAAPPLPAPALPASPAAPPGPAPLPPPSAVVPFPLELRLPPPVRFSPGPRGRGRHGAFGDARANQMLAVARTGATQDVIAAAGGVHVDTLRDWLRRKDEPRYIEFQAAYAEAGTYFVLAALKAIMEGMPGDPKLALEALARRYPDAWGRTLRVGGALGLYPVSEQAARHAAALPAGALDEEIAAQEVVLRQLEAGDEGEEGGGP